MEELFKQVKEYYEASEALDTPKWSTPCANDCQLKFLYPYYHQPHKPLYNGGTCLTPESVSEAEELSPELPDAPKTGEREELPF